MEVYDGPYFRINKMLMTKGGLWPYERNYAKKLASRLYVGLSISALTLPQLYGLYKNFGVHAGQTIEHMALLLYMLATLLKFITAISAESNLKKVYDSVAENWADTRDPQERKILTRYSENGVKLTKSYLAYMVIASTFYMIAPLTPLLLNVVAPSNETRLPDFIFKGEFPVDDMRDYYVEIFVFDVLGCCSTMYVLVTVDGMYAACIEHCCGLFAIIKHRLKLCTDVEDRGRNAAYKTIVEIVKLHTKIIDFADLLEKSYSRSFLILIGLNVLHCSFISVMLLIRRNEPKELLRNLCIMGGIVMHLFYVSWPGQKLIDHSTGLFDDVCTNDCYTMSRESQRLLRFVRMRCSKPCQLTAGGIYIMNLENFAAIMKASGSYMTVFSSFT